MDLIISEQEYGATTAQISDAAEEAILVAKSYIACLQGVKEHGYRSAASAAAINSRCAKVKSALDAFASAVDGLSAKTERHLDAIASIDRMVL